MSNIYLGQINTCRSRFASEEAEQELRVRVADQRSEEEGLGKDLFSFLFLAKQRISIER